MLDHGTGARRIGVLAYRAVLTFDSFRAFVNADSEVITGDVDVFSLFCSGSPLTADISLRGDGRGISNTGRLPTVAGR